MQSDGTIARTLGDAPTDVGRRRQRYASRSDAGLESGGYRPGDVDFDKLFRDVIRAVSRCQWACWQKKAIECTGLIHHDMIFARIRSWRSRDEFQSQSVARKLLGVLLLVQEVRGSTCTASTSAWLASASLTRLVAGRPGIAGRGRGPAGRPRVLGDPRHAAAVDRVPGRRPGRLFRIPTTRFPCFRERLGMKLKGRVGHQRQSSAGLGAIGLS
jgi:hypothetical protein